MNYFLYISRGKRERKGFSLKFKMFFINCKELQRIILLVYVEPLKGRVYLGVKTCEVLVCFIAIVRVRVYILTSLLSLFYVTAWCVLHVLTPGMCRKVFSALNKANIT